MLLATRLKPCLVSKTHASFFLKLMLFSIQPQCCWTFSWIGLLLRCCLIHATIIILRQILYLVYLYPCLGLGLSMPYLCDLFLVFSLIFIAINHITSFKQTYLFFEHILEYLLLFLMIIWMKKVNNFQRAKVQLQAASGRCLAFACFLPISVLLIKKRVH